MAIGGYLRMFQPTGYIWTAFLDGRGNTDSQVTDQVLKFINDYYADRSRQRMRVKDVIETFLKNLQPKQRKRAGSHFSGRRID
jgi:hypothetical protein